MNARASHLGQTLEQVGAHVAERHMDADASLRLENARLVREVAALRARLSEVERTADADPLVDIYNRRAFVREISRAQALCGRYHIPSTVLYFDLDGFKAVNDRYGHTIGDDILRAVGRTLSESVRECDLVARLGGDEFGVLLFKTRLGEASAKAEALLCRIQACKVTLPTGDVGVGASWGAAPCEPGLPAEDVLTRSDRAMYFAKADAR